MDKKRMEDLLHQLHQLQDFKKESLKMQKELTSLRKEVADLKDTTLELHEDVMNLKGSIRVFVRLRPLLTGSPRVIPHPDSTCKDVYSHFAFPDSTKRRECIQVHHAP
ncbi:hypothetical protein ADUPG1_013402 [Aduncisulcus paluster]|uniref:Uncharacterized protein n=1 Tax=Aduncisulcus paluster TaxID=2918883 RepID=A0ABQ5K3B5_9EUKA|nr:hypothetical protein ADUPG1_013402 [Aduncisulcus paluster]